MAGCLLLLTLLTLAGHGLAAPYTVEPDYHNVIASLDTLNASDTADGGARHRTTEEEEQHLLRERIKERRLREIRAQILRKLNLKCVPSAPRRPVISAAELSQIHQIFDNLRNNTDRERQDLLKRAQSFYPSCDLPLGADDSLWRQHDSMNVFFNLSRFFLTLPLDVEIDAAELRLHKFAPQNFEEPPQALDYGLSDEEKIRVSVYVYTSPLGPEAEVNETRLVDSQMVARSLNDWVRFDVKQVVPSWSDDFNFGLMITVEDLEGNLLSPEDYFDNMDCDLDRPSSPMPGMMWKIAADEDIAVTSDDYYPVLDLLTAELEPDIVTNGALPAAQKPCPPGDSDFSVHGVSAADYPSYSPTDELADDHRSSVRLAASRTHWRHRRRHHRHHRHHRRHRGHHSGAEGSTEAEARHRGQN